MPFSRQKQHQLSVRKLVMSYNVASSSNETLLHLEKMPTLRSERLLHQVNEFGVNKKVYLLPL